MSTNNQEIYKSKKVGNDLIVHKEIKSKKFPDEIIRTALDVYNSIIEYTKTERKDARKKLVAFCIYAAHIKHGVIPIQSEICNQCEIEEYAIFTAGIREYSYPKTNYKLIEPKYNIRDYIEPYCILMNVTESTTHDLLKFFDELVEKKPKLLRSMTAHFLSGLFCYFFETCGNPFSTEYLSKMFLVSETVVLTNQQIVSSSANS